MEDEERDVSYGELVELQNMFYERIEAIGVEFPDEETEQECLMDYQQQYQFGCDNPIIRFLWNDDEDKLRHYDNEYRRLFPEDFEE